MFEINVPLYIYYIEVTWY